MANKKHHHIFMQGAKVWNAWRKEHPELRPNLRSIDIGIDTTEYMRFRDRGEDSLILSQFDNFRLNAVKLSTEELVGINLSNTDLRDTNFWMVNFSHADLRGANLAGAYLRDTNFYRANLKGANLKESLLRATLFTSTCLDEADFSLAELNLTKFQYVDLSATKGLETCRIPYPQIDVATLLLSNGCIPDILLPHVKFSQALIDYARSLTFSSIKSNGSVSPSGHIPLKLFYCYAREDEYLREQLEKHLSLFKQEGLIVTWCDREITAGEDYEQKILLNIETSDIFLALVSPAFMSSDYCHNIELKRALDRHISGKMRVVPVILRPVDWQGPPLGDLQALPRDGLPVTEWRSIDRGLIDVVRGIRKVVEELQITQKTFAPEISVLDEKRGFELLILGSHAGSDTFYWEAIETFQRAVDSNPYNMDAWSGMAEAWFSLQRYQEALLVCEHVLQVPTFSERYWATLTLKAAALEKVGRLEEAENIKAMIRKEENNATKEKDTKWYLDWPFK
jgi:uncharacterized protein YjbI with pentapeptide repeats